MGRGEVIVNRVARMGGTLVGETDIPLGVIRTPAWIPSLDTRTDFELALSGRGLVRKPEIVAFKIESLHKLTAGRVAAADFQRTLTNASADPQFDNFRSKTFTFVDPLSEFFTTKGLAWGAPKPSRTPMHERIAELPGFPEDVAKLAMGGRAARRRFWQDVIDKDLLVALIDWYHQHQKGLRPAIFIPPVNVIDGKSTLQTAMRINQTAADAFPPGEEPVVPAMYLILDPKVLTAPSFMEGLFNEISTAASDQRVIVTKVLWLRNVVEDAVKRDNLREHFARIDQLKRSVEDGFLHLVLEAWEEGLAFMGNGVDGYVEPASGFKVYPRAAKSKEEREAAALELDIEEQPDRWLHPVLRVDKPLTDAEIGRLCSCPAHSEQTTDGVTRRRAHRANVRMNEVEMLVDAIGHGDIEFLRRKLAQGENRNLLGLVPDTREGASRDLRP